MQSIYKWKVGTNAFSTHTHPFPFFIPQKTEFSPLWEKVLNFPELIYVS